MSMTDPIADLLTRIRNAQRAKHDRLDVPASNVKLEVCRILKEEGYIKNVTVVEQQPRNLIRVYLSTPRRVSRGSQRMRRVSTPGPPGLPRRGADQAGPQRPRHRHRLHLAGADDRPPGARAERRRRAALRDLVGGRHVTHRKKASSPSPPASRSASRTACSLAEGPKGKVRQTLLAGHRRRGRRQPAAGHPQRRRARDPRPPRPDARAGRQRRAGRGPGFEKTLEIVGVGYRAEVKGRELHMRSATRTRWCSPSPRASRSDREEHPDQRARRRQAAGRAGGGRDPQLAAARRLQGQGRALQRREAEAQGRQGRRQVVRSDRRETDLKQSQTKQWRRERAHLRVRSRVSGTAERPRLSVYKSLQLRLRPGHRRQQGVTLVAASSLEPVLKAAARHRRGNGAAAKLVGARSPSGPRSRASRRWSSTAAATSITAGSRRSPTPRARRA